MIYNKFTQCNDLDGPFSSQRMSRYFSNLGRVLFALDSNLLRCPIQSSMTTYPRSLIYLY